jgi:hypothetical protein
MVAGEDADDDPAVVDLEDTDIVFHVRREVAGLVRDLVAADVARNAGAIQLASA